MSDNPIPNGFEKLLESLEDVKQYIPDQKYIEAMDSMSLILQDYRQAINAEDQTEIDGDGDASAGDDISTVSSDADDLVSQNIGASRDIASDTPINKTVIPIQPPPSVSTSPVVIEPSQEPTDSGILGIKTTEVDVKEPTSQPPVLNLTLKFENTPNPNSTIDKLEPPPAVPEVPIVDKIEQKMGDVITESPAINPKNSEEQKSVSINPAVRVITIDTKASPMSGGGKPIYEDVMDPYK